ncbi:MAG: ArsR/SmtB family transcription factor [Candidatus Njordarchaeia archaeon]
MDEYEDELKRLKEEVEKLRKEIRELKSFKPRTPEAVGQIVDTIMRKIPFLIEREIDKALTEKRGVDAIKKITIFPFKTPSIESKERKIYSIEEEIDKILEDIIPEGSSPENTGLTANLETLIKKIDPAEVSDAIVVLANSDRIKLLQLLYENDRYFSELEEKLRLGPSSLRHHLSKLLAGNLISQERSRGKYSITKRGVAALILIAYLYEKILKKLNPNDEVEENE